MRAYLDECTLIEDSGGRLWLPVKELQRARIEAPRLVEIIQVGDEFYEAMGYSEFRKAVWVQPITIEGAAACLEEELNE